MSPIQEKYHRFLFVERSFRLKLLVCGVLLISIVVLNRSLVFQKKKLLSLRAKKEIAMKIPELQESILAKTRKPDDFVPQVVVVPPPPKELHFEGSSNQDGVLHTVIDGEVLMHGDRIGKWVVKEIQIGFVQLENMETKETKEYYFEYSE